MSENPSPTDEQLMQRVERQNQTAFGVLYQRYGRQVYGLAYQITRNTTLAEEITQDTFMKVWRRASQWDASKGQLASWLLTITRYTAIDRIRAENRQPDATSLEFAIEPRSADGSPHDALMQDGRLLRELMTELPDEQAEVIQMAFFQGLSHSQLAEELKLPLGTVKTRVRLGLQKLKALWLEATKESS